MEHKDLETLEAGMDEVRHSPSVDGRVELIVRRTGPGEREVVSGATLDVVDGLVGNDWCSRHNRHAPDGSPDIDKQIALMNARAAGLIAGPKERWPLAGDQLYVDFDLRSADSTCVASMPA